MACVTSKCCFCVPLRPGLLLWAYIKLMMTVALIVFEFFLYLNGYHSEASRALIFLWIVIGVTLVYIVFSVVFVIGMHNESYKLLLVYYRFSMFEALLSISALGFDVFTIVLYGSEMASNYYRHPAWIAHVVGYIVTSIVLPIYLIILLRSELMQIKVQEEEDVKTSVQDARVVLDVPIAGEEDRKYDFVYAHPESQEVPKMTLFPVEELERLRQQLGLKRDA